MSSLVEIIDIGVEYWLQESRAGVIKPIPEVGDVDLQTRFDKLSMAYTLLSNEKQKFHSNFKYNWRSSAPTMIISRNDKKKMTVQWIITS